MAPRRKWSSVTDNMNAESDMGSVITNIVPKDGGNRYSGTLGGSYTNPSWEGDNLDDKLRSQGVTAVNKVAALWEVLPSAGGRSSRTSCGFTPASANSG